MNSDLGLVVLPDEADLELFARSSAKERVLTAPLSLLLAETATSGTLRYAWPLYCPLVEHALEKAMRDLSPSREEVEPEIGPRLDTITRSIEHFKSILSGFRQAPWTIQRLCELILNPRRQYNQIDKLAHALEKLLMITTEVPHQTQTSAQPTLPISLLSSINANPPRVYEPANPRGGTPAAHHQPNPQDALSAAFLSSMVDVSNRVHMSHQHHGPHTIMDHIAEDHWPSNIEAVSHHPFPNGQDWSPFSPSSTSHSPPAAATLHEGIRHEIFANAAAETLHQEI